MNHAKDGGVMRQQRRARLLRVHLFVVATLLAAGCGSSLASASPSPGRDSGYLYWTTIHGIGRAHLDGSHVNQRFLTGVSDPGMIAVSSGHLYWANTGSPGAPDGSGSIGRADLNGSHVNEKFITGASLPVGVTVAGGYLYWTSNGTGTIGRARLNGTHVTQRFITTAQAGGPDAVVTGSGHIYWANDYNIGRADLNGTHVDQDFIAVPNGPKGVAGLAVNSRYIYWTNEWGNAIGRARLDGSHVDQKFITGAGLPDAMAVDSRYIYWANAKSGTIGHAWLNGSHVNQRFITISGGLNSDVRGVAADPRG